MQQSDLLIALGSRFDDRVTGKVPTLRPRRQDHPRRHRPGRAGQGPPARRADRRRLPPGHRGARQGDPATCGGADAQPDRSRLERPRSAAGRRSYPLTYEPSEPGELLKPQYVLEQLRDRTPDDTIVASGVGQHQMWASPVLEVPPPLHLGELRWARHDGLLRCRRPSAPRSAAPTAWSGPSTATAASR